MTTQPTDPEAPTEEQVPPAEEPAPNQPEPEYPPESPKVVLRFIRQERHSISIKLDQLNADLEKHTTAARDIRKQIKDLEAQQTGLDQAQDAIEALPGNPIS